MPYPCVPSPARSGFAEPTFGSGTIGVVVRVGPRDGTRTVFGLLPRTPAGPGRIDRLEVELGGHVRAGTGPQPGQRPR